MEDAEMKLRVVEWLEACASRARRLAEVRAQLAEFEGDAADGVKTARVEQVHVRTFEDKRDRIGGLVVAREQRMAELEDERRALARELDAAAAVIARAVESDGAVRPAAWRYVVLRYLHARTAADAARAVGMSYWTCKRFARELAPAIHAAAPGVFAERAPFGEYEDRLGHGA